MQIFENKISELSNPAKILLLGSTGSIGISSLEVIKHLGKNFSVSALTTNRNIDLLEKQIIDYKPEKAVVIDSEKAATLRERIGTRCEVLCGPEGLLELTRNSDYDILISALVGFAGLAPTLESIKRGKRIALANKETLVAAGEIVMNLVKSKNVEILPVDSEHSAIFQCLVGESEKNINKLILTASGGPFYNKSIEKLQNVSIEEALNHPNWNMGNKITIDSATMMNKGLEVIEAHWLFSIDQNKIDILIHPQSIIHSMVEFNDGSIKAQLSTPDMKLPIQYSLTFPNRINNNFVTTNLAEIAELSFFKPDLKKFECLGLAYEALTTGGTAPCILNAANEVAVKKFLEGTLKFLEIPDLVKFALDKIESKQNPDIGTIFETDRMTRELVQSNFN